MLWTTSGTVALGAIIIQQVLVGSSNFWLIGAQKSLVASHGQTYLWASAFVAALLLPYLPGTFSLFSAEKWKHEVLLRFGRALEQRHHGQTLYAKDPAIGEKLTSLLASEAKQCIVQLIDSLYTITASGLNVLCNLLPLAILLDGSLAVAYAVGATLAGMFIYCSYARQAVAARQEQQAELVLLDRARKFQANRMIGNEMQRFLWQGQFFASMQAWSQRALHRAWDERCTSFAATMMLGIPIFCYLLWKMYQLQTEPVLLGAMVINLPRLMFTLAVLEMFVSFVLKSVPVVSKFRQLIAMGADVSYQQQHPLERISPEHLQVVHSSTGALIGLNNLLEQAIAKREPSLWVLLGKNGSGKSTLLQYVKQYTKAASFYLPADPSLLLVPGKEAPGLSSGQQVMALLEQRAQLPATTWLLLLDEPDANLDADNRNLLQQKINALTQRKTIIQVQHHGPGQQQMESKNVSEQDDNPPKASTSSTIPVLSQRKPRRVAYLQSMRCCGIWP